MGIVKNKFSISLSILIFLLVGLYSSPFFYDVAEGKLNRWISEAEFSKAQMLLGCGFTVKNKKRIVESLFASYRNNDPDKVDAFAKKLVNNKQFDFLSTREYIENLVSKIVLSEIYIYEKLLRILIERIDLKVLFKENHNHLIEKAAGDSTHLYENKEFEFRFNFSSIRLLKLLAANGIVLDPQNYNEFSPLMISSHFGDLKAVRFLIEQGALKNHKVKSGRWNNFSAIDFAKLGLRNVENSKEKLKFNQRLFVVRKVEAYKKIIGLLEKKGEDY